MGLEYQGTLVINRNEALTEQAWHQQVGRGRRITDRGRKPPSIKNVFGHFQIDLARRQQASLAFDRSSAST